MKNLAKIKNKGEKKTKKAEEQVYFIISFLDTTFSVLLAHIYIEPMYSSLYKSEGKKSL